MEALTALWSIVKSHWGKVAIVFVVSGVVGVLGLVPGTENVSNIIGNQITGIKAELGTTASPTVVQ